MRFIADGPDIPEELLIARDRGDVIFFCGAGVSQANAGLPDFERLGRDVIEVLGAALDSPARLLLNKALQMGRMAGVGGLLATDRVFGLLEREFEVADVREAVASAIRPPTGYGLQAHRILLDLATPPTGVTRLVTTNFDLLFEACEPTLQCWGPPRLPDPRNDREFRGIVHLHGRVDSEYNQPSDDEFVVSSADFGRAYLSDGWATRFIQSLLSRYQIAFVGYNADDPPVQYLLEALNLHAGTRARLFAFQEGDAGEAAALWEHRGVRAIPFDSAEGFGPLWDTLAAWAERARDLDGWYADLIEKAVEGPAAADPHFRGMIAKLLATREGARRVATASKTLDAQWLLAMDPIQRYAPAGITEPFNETEGISDPFEALGLDCDAAPDPPNPDRQFHRRSPPDGSFDPLSKNHFDDADRDEVGMGALRGSQALLDAAMPPRLASLGVWIQRVAHEPLALWWAAQQVGLHPEIQQKIQWSLRQGPERFPQRVRKGWELLFAAWSDRRDDPNMVRYDLEARAAHDGWSFSLVRAVASMFRPRLTVREAFGIPHPLNWTGPAPDGFIRVDIEYPRPHEPLVVPDGFVAYAVAQFRENLELSIALEREIRGDDQLYIETTRAGDEGPELSEDSYGLTGPIILLQNLMARLSLIDRGAARAEVRRWSEADEYVFARLRIWAAGRRDLLDGHEAAAIFLGLSDRVFWGSQHERDLLYALRDRWQDFSADDRMAIEARLLSGSFPWSEEVRGGLARAVASDRLSRLYWLSTQGVVFAFDLEAEMVPLRAAAPDWTQLVGERAADSHAPEVQSIITDDTADALLDVPLGDVLAHAQEAGRLDIRGRVQREPFQGLAKRRPVRALLALVHAARKGEVPRQLWGRFLRSEARKADKPRMVRTIAARVCQLPNERVHEIAYPISEWMEENADRFFGDAASALPPLWNRMIEVLTVGNTGPAHRPDRSWADEALNAPVGRLVNLLMKDPAKNGLLPGAGYPLEWRNRLDQLLNLPGDLRRQALVLISFQLTWLFTVDPIWTERTLLPAADDAGQDGNAFWSGFLSAARTPSAELYRRLKPGLLAKAIEPNARRSEGNIIAGMLLVVWGANGELHEPEWLLSDVEFREILIHADDTFRCQILSNLEHWVSGGEGQWRERALPFLRKVWPKQRALHTPQVAGQLAQFALASGDLMPEVVGVILRRLVPVGRGGFHTFALNSDSPDFPARRYPKATLDLLVAILPEDSGAWPYKIEAVLDVLEQSPDTKFDLRLSDLRRRRER